MESKLNKQEKTEMNTKEKITAFEKYNIALQNYIENLESNELTGVDSTSEFNTTNCMFL